jgi:hypothetical protein
MRATGLLKKALSLRDNTPHLRLLPPEEMRDEREPDIPAEEREKILAQIEKVVSRSRMKVTPKTFLFTASRKGSVLPLIVNLAAVLVVAAGIYLAVQLSRRTEASIVSAPTVLLSAEGKMVEALKEEARQQLAGKDGEIAAIRARLSSIDGERDRIRREADASVHQREQQLAEAFARTLEEEQARLQARGLSEAAVARRMADFETKNRAALDAQRAAFRGQADADRAEKERTIAKLQAEYEQTLSQAQAERNRIHEESARRQSDLEAGYRQKQLALEQDTSAALAELATLRQQREKEQLAQDQFLGFYRTAREEIQAGRPEAARQALADFRAYLDQPGLASLPGIVRRRPVELFLIDSLEQLIRAQAAEGSAAQSIQSLAASAGLIASVAALVQQGDALFEERGYTQARELYLSALARIPAVQSGYERLGEIEKTFTDQKKKDIAALMAAGNVSYRAGDFDAAVQRYGRALEALQGERTGVDTLVAQLIDIGAQRSAAEAARAGAPAVPVAAAPAPPDAAAQQRARSAAVLADMRARLAAGGAASGQAEDARTTLVALLAAKLLVQNILLSPEVAKKYPDLYDQMNRYLDALAAESRADARRETLADMDALLGAVMGSSGGPAPEGALARSAAPDQQGLVLSILDKLKALLQ